MQVDGVKDRLTAALGIDLLYIHDPELTRYNVQVEAMTLTASPSDLCSLEVSPTFIHKRQRRLQGTSSVTLKVVGKGLTAGLAVYKDEYRYLRISYSSSMHSVNFQVVNKAKGIKRSEERLLEGTFQTIGFMIYNTETEYRLSYRVGSGNETELANEPMLELRNKDFVGPVVGVYTVDENVEGGGLKAEFQHFRVDHV
jgi:hypothetical protein